MTNKEVDELIGKRVMELVSMPEIQAEMVKIANEKGKEAAEKMIYMTVIGTLNWIAGIIYSRPGGYEGIRRKK